MVQGWQEASAAFQQFPFDVGVVYRAPLQFGPANPLWPRATGHRATMLGFPYDDVDRWRTAYPAEVFAAQLETVADGFQRFVTGLTKATSLDGRAYDIACGQIDIGNADTPMGSKMKAGVAQADGSTRPEAVMDPDHIGDAVLMMANLPLEANVQFMTVMATKMPFVGRG